MEVVGFTELVELAEVVGFTESVEAAGLTGATGFAWAELSTDVVAVFWANGLLFEGLLAPKLAGVWPELLNWFDARKGLLFELSIIIFY